VRKSRLFFVFIVLTAAAALAQNAPKNRILRPIQETQLQAVPGNMRPQARAEFDRGQVDPSMPLEHVAIVFRLSAQQQAALEELLKEQQDPSSPNFHKWLTPEQYAARFGMSQSDLSQVAAWLQSQGLTYDGVSRGHTEIYFSGTAGQIAYALHTDIHHYLVNGKMHYANATNPSLPAAFAGSVLAVRGLNDFRPKPHNVRMRSVPASPEFTSNLQPGYHFLTPNDFATIYDAKPLYNAGFDGTGQSIAVLGQTVLCPSNPCGATNTSEIGEYRAAAGLSPVSAQNFSAVLVPGSGSPFMLSDGDEVESDLDVELSGGIAKNALVIFVYTGNTDGNGVWDSLQYAVDQDIAPVISTSYGYCESGLGAAFVDELQQWAQQANAQGQTIVAASGDDGAADCDSGASATQGLAVDVPASIPEVTGMGGNQFTGDASSTSTTQYWNGSNDSGGGSALSYIPEDAWNTTSTDDQLSASGGGVSSIFSKPSWQKGTGVPNDGKRDVPDLSLNASPDHDPYIICSQALFRSSGSTTTSCTNGFRAADSSLAAVGGTSTAAPAFAAVIALINQATQSIGQGNVNPILYSLVVSNPNAFHDVTVGNNVIPCTKGTPNCPASSPFQFGYSAGTGYDQVTGLGSIDVGNLWSAWPSSNGSTASEVSVSASSPTINPGDSVTFTATVTSSSSGGATPTGSVQFRVDGANAGPPVALSNGQATLTLSTLTGGAHAILAVYSGDGTYQSSTSAAITETVSDFSVSGTPITVTAGNNGTSTITVTSLNGFTGMVSLTCTPSSATAHIGCSLSPTQVSPGTPSTLTVTTAAPNFVGGARAKNDPAKPFGWFAVTGGGFLAAIVIFGVPSRKRRHAALMGVVLVAFVAAGTSCGGGGSNSSSNSTSGVPATPTGLTATASNGQVVLTWNAVSGAVTYNVKRSTVSGGPYSTIASPTATSYTDTSVSNNTPYFYVVSAVNGSGESNSSAQVTATPSSGGTPTGSYTITVTGTSGGTTHTASVALTVQ
jgi:subtilase family serine protease